MRWYCMLTKTLRHWIFLYFWVARQNHCNFLAMQIITYLPNAELKFLPKLAKSMPPSPMKIMARSPKWATVWTMPQAAASNSKSNFHCQLCSQRETVFSKRHPQQDPGNEGVQPITPGRLSSEVRPANLQGHSGEGAKQQQPSPSQPLKTSEDLCP